MGKRIVFLEAIGLLSSYKCDLSVYGMVTYTIM